MSELTPKKVESPRFSKRAKIITSIATASLFVAGGVGFSIANSGEKPSEATKTSASAFPTHEATANEIEPGASTSEYIVPLEQLPSMTPEQLTSLTTISVESVSVNGAIDWDLYVDKLYAIYNLQANAGVTKGELDTVYATTNTPKESLSQKYNDPMAQGYSAEDISAPDSLVSGVHDNIVRASYAQYLTTDKLSVHATFTKENVTIREVDPIGGTVLSIEGLYQDNLFSSGAISVDDAKAVEGLGRSADAHIDIKDRMLVRTIDGNLYIRSMSTE